MILPLSSVKVGTCAPIASLKVVDDYSKLISRKLVDVGFVRGREIKLMNKNSTMYIAKVGHDNPFCFHKDVADVIMIESSNIEEKSSFWQKLLKKVKYL